VAQQDSLTQDVPDELYEEESYGEPKRIWMGEFNMLYSIPTGAFAERVDNQFWGFDLGIMRQYRPTSPLFWRLGLSYIHMGGFDAEIDRFFDFITERWDSRTETHQATFTVGARYFLPVSIFGFEPFLEGNFGTNWMLTTTTLTFPETGDQESTTNRGNLSFTYGIGVGVNYQIHNDFYLNAKCQYQLGVATSYYAFDQEKATTFNSNRTLDAFSDHSTTTDQVRLLLGIVYAF